MQLTIYNQASGIRSYLGGIVTVADGGSTAIARDLNVVLAGDAQFIADCTSETVRINNGATDLSGPSALILIEFLSGFATDPLATLFLYYSANVNIRQTAATTAGNTVWAMRNPAASTVSLVIEKISLKMDFDSTDPVSAKLLRYGFYRFSTATPSGGTTITAIKASNLAAASGADIRFADTGLTTTSVVFESAPFAVVACPAVKGTVVYYERGDVYTKLAAGEGLAIRLETVDATIGQGLTGEIVWSIR